MLSNSHWEEKTIGEIYISSFIPSYYKLDPQFTAHSVGFE
jgi:hypothetical protein